MIAIDFIFSLQRTLFALLYTYACIYLLLCIYWDITLTWRAGSRVNWIAHQVTSVHKVTLKTYMHWLLARMWKSRGILLSMLMYFTLCMWVCRGKTMRLDTKKRTHGMHPSEHRSFVSGVSPVVSTVHVHVCLEQNTVKWEQLENDFIHYFLHPLVFHPHRTSLNHHRLIIHTQYQSNERVVCIRRVCCQSFSINADQVSPSKSSNKATMAVHASTKGEHSKQRSHHMLLLFSHPRTSTWISDPPATPHYALRNMQIWCRRQHIRPFHKRYAHSCCLTSTRTYDGSQIIEEGMRQLYSLDYV